MIAEVKGLCKSYPSFCLQNVSFQIEEGHIVGFVGRNGAGKSTTIKSMLNLVHPDHGDIRYFEKPFLENESELKKQIGYSTGTISWYPRKKLKDIASVVRDFYETWDEAAYLYYLRLFSLDENKTTAELSEGMKVKSNLLMSLSHRAKLLILDEPTSGLDPFSRDELLECFRKLKEDGVAVFFSTHIISELDKCADDILYISVGKIVASLPKNDFMSEYANSNENLEQTLLRMERGVIHA